MKSFLYFALMNAISDKAKQFLMLTVKILIVLAAFFFIFQKLSGNDSPDREQFVAILQRKLSVGGILFLLLLSFINRFLEILKWKNLVGSFEEISVGKASQQVLSAFTASIFTPNGIGEYAGKAIYYEKSKTKKILFLNFINNGIQMLLSLVFGIFGLLYFNTKFPVITTRTIIIVFVISCIFLLASFSLKRFTVKGYSLEKLIRKISHLPKSIHRRNNFFGLCRYLIFSHQYYFLFLAFNVHLPYLILMSAIASIYLLASSLPSFQFFDFAIKGSVAVFFFGFLGVNGWIVVFITTLMWFLNVVLPVAIGSYFVLNFRLNPAI